MFKSINPATGHIIAHYPTMSEELLAAVLDEASTSAMAWARVEVSLRGSMLARVAALLEAKQGVFARLVGIKKSGIYRQSFMGNVALVAAAVLNRI